uniref:Uncharacterized protein n=1 Tax=Octopus bimaculoides TaxID=37653 RepID=A0A0L8G4A1_OCTBM
MLYTGNSLIETNATPKRLYTNTTPTMLYTHTMPKMLYTNAIHLRLYNNRKSEMSQKDITSTSLIFSGSPKSSNSDASPAK